MSLVIINPKKVDKTIKALKITHELNEQETLSEVRKHLVFFSFARTSNDRKETIR